MAKGRRTTMVKPETESKPVEVALAPPPPQGQRILVLQSNSPKVTNGITLSRREVKIAANRHNLELDTDGRGEVQAFLHIDLVDHNPITKCSAEHVQPDRYSGPARDGGRRSNRFAG